MRLNGFLALLDALLTSASTVCMVLGYAAIRRKEVERHRRLMLAAFGAAAAFVVSFVTRYVCFGRTEFSAHGVVRGVYLAVWFSHEPMAVLSIPLVIAAAVLGLRRSVEAHREVARMALPVWLYTSTTGILIYLLVYLWPG